MNKPRVTNQIPLYNETDALRLSHFYFTAIGVPVRYAMDTQALPATRAIARELGIKPLEFANDRPFIEHGYPAFSAAADNDWILRIDCDELPTPELIAFAREFVEQGGEGVVSFEREQVIWSGGGFQRPMNPRFDPKGQRQYRLYDRRAVVFDQAIHTPGIKVEAVTHAPPGAKIYHLSWELLSWDDRVAKADRYEAYGQAAFNRDNQLLDLAQQEWAKVEPTTVDEVYAAWRRTGI